MKNWQPITEEMLNNDFNEYNKEKANHVLRHALTNTSINTVCKTQDTSDEIDYSFSLDIKTMDVTNQKASGRCWIFAATNVLREIIGKKLSIPQFELSQSYIAFYDKFEKINYELEAIIDLIDKEHDDRTLVTVMNNTIGDGGQWDMFVNVVSKYGIIPKNQMIETFTSSATAELNRLISVNLNKFAAISKDIYKKEGIEGLRKEKEKELKKFYNLLVSCYGLPVKEFDLEYVDKDGKYHLEKGWTPKKFYDEFVKDEVESYVSLINAPTEDKPFQKSYTIDYLGNVVGGKDIKHLNVTMDRMVELILKQMNDGRIVWFGSDVGFYRDRQGYAWDDKSFDFTTPFELDYYIDKGKALDYSISAMNHAMCIVGVNIVDGKPTKWKIENSWGSENAKRGYYLMSDSWFRQYVYQAVIDKKYLSEEEQKAYDAEPIHLKPWDPMGSLAD